MHHRPNVGGAVWVVNNTDFLSGQRGPWMGQGMSDIRILLAEDNSEHQNLLLLALVGKRPRINVTVVSSGAEFLRAVKNEKYDCAVLDYNLQDYYAPELLKAVQGLTQDCPMLVISSSDEQSVVVESMRSGGVDFLPKHEAVQGDYLWRRVGASILESRRQRRDRRRSERRERYLAKAFDTDPLTGLYNRRYLDRCLLQRRWQNDRRQQCCMMIDVDHFKQINDTHGHPAGDKILKQVAHAIRQQVDSSGTAVRYGGEEFLVIRPASTLADAWIHAERIRRKIEHTAVSSLENAAHITVSIGLVLADTQRISPEMIDHADKALYMAKNQGRNTVCTWKMVEIDTVLQRVTAKKNTNLERNSKQFLANCRSLLGPTQWEHLTSHAARVGGAAYNIASAMKLDPEYAQRVRTASLLHDIGKCLLPEELLAKPSSLAFEEWHLIARHAEMGAWIARQLGVDEQTAQMIHHHHTRFDSCKTDDPDSPKAPLGARIICVADALVTMTTDRSYRPRLSTTEALRELQRERGRQFDPDIVDVAYFAKPVALAEAA